MTNAAHRGAAGIITIGFPRYYTQAIKIMLRNGSKVLTVINLFVVRGHYNFKLREATVPKGIETVQLSNDVQVKKQYIKWTQNHSLYTWRGMEAS